MGTFATRLIALIVLAIGFIGSASLNQPCPSALRTNVVANYRGELVFVCLQPTTPPKLDVVSYARRKLIASLQVDERGRPDKISSFLDDEGNLRIILAVPDRINGTSIYTLDKNGHYLREIHTVSTQFVDQLNTWRLELNLEWQLAIANQPAYEPSLLSGRAISQRMPPLPEPKPIISIYSWRSTYFDRYQLINLPQDGRVTKLEPMNINGQEFLIVAMDSDRADKESGLALDSLIYKLDFGSADLEWREFQRLPTGFAHDVRPFTLTHRGSLQQDYYIAALGRMKVVKDFHTTAGRFNVTDEEDGLIVYKYLGDKFVQTHAYPAPDMTKLEAVTYGQGDTSVIMALLSERTRNLVLLSFDGLTFQALPNPNLIPTRRPASRQRRTMTSLQLFLAPQHPSSTGELNETLAKRTLASEQSQPMTPMLSFSDPELYHEASASESRSPEAAAQGAYQIPVERDATGSGTADETTPGPDSGHSKRDRIPHDRVAEDLLGWCKATINSVLLDNFDHLSKQLLVLPRVDQHEPIELNGDLLIEDDLHISNLLYVRRVEEVRGTNKQYVVETNPSNFSYTFDEIQRVHREIDAVKNHVDQILVDDGSDQNVYSNFAFDTLVVECHQPGFDLPSPSYPNFNNRINCPHIDNIRTTYLNSHNISNIHRQALLTGRSMVIERDVRFEHLILMGTVDIRNTLNGIPLSDIVFKRGFVAGPIIGHKHFQAGLFSQSNLNVAKWRDTHVDRSAFFTSSGDQTIPSMRFTQVIIDSTFNGQNLSSLIKRLNGLDLGQHLNQIALSGADNQFETPIQFDELVLNGPIHMVGGLSHLSSIDLEDLWLHTMFKHSTQNISVHMDFIGPVHFSYGGNIIVNGPVNGIWLKPNEILMSDMDYHMQNPIIFDGNLQVNHLQVHRALNGIQVMLKAETQTPELALLYNEGNQQITGDKVFSSIYLGGQSSILGLINGHLNLTHLHNLANSHDQPHFFQKIRLTGQDIRTSDRASFHVSSTINGVSVQDLCNLAMYANNKTAANYMSLRFEQPISLKSLRCSSINGFTDLSSTFLTKYGDQYVSGDLRLANGAIFNTTLNIQSTLNGLPVASLSRAVSRAINETKTGHKDFYGDLVVEELNANRINDLQLSDIFLAKSDSPQIVRASMTFDHLDIENVLNVGNLATNSFNNLNVTDVMTNTLTYDTFQVIYNHIQLDTLQLLAGSDLITRSVNGRNLRRVFSDAVLYDVPQQILAPKTFRAPVEFAERMYLRHSIDGLSFEDIRANLLLLSDDLIDGDLVLNSDCTINKLLEIQSKTINDVDLDAFMSNMIRNGQPLRVAANGSIRFHDVAAKDVIVGGTIQGIDLSREAVWLPKIPGQVPANKQQPQQQQRPQNLQLTPALPLAPLPLLPPLPPPPPPPQYQALTLPQAQHLPQEMHSPPGRANMTTGMSNPQDDYNAYLKANAMADLSSRVNRHLSLNFYYEIVQKHPLLGPLMYYARDSLFLKATGKPGEPCSHQGQTIAIMSKGQQKPPFTQTSRILETSNPRSISAVANHLFILDEDPSPQVLLLTWNQEKSLYELQERLPLDVAALSIKAFSSADRSCIAVASSNATIYCQTKQGSRFSEKSSLNMLPSVVDLDVWPIPATTQVLLATISHQNTRQIGDLTISILDTQSKQFTVVASKKMIRPLKLHFFKNGLWTPEIQLAVAEAITNNDNVLATSRIFSMRVGSSNQQPGNAQGANGSVQFHFHEVQEIRDHQFSDIQSVLLDESRALLLLKSTHSISVYAPSIGPDYSVACDAQLSLLQRIPTKGANKFLVFNDSTRQQLLAQRSHNGTSVGGAARIPFDHYLVLSKDECDEKQQYSTLILKAQFR